MAQYKDFVLQSNEKIIFALRELYLTHGYRHYSMSKFEEYDLYAKNKDFLISDNVITFTDTDGKLMALKPDVTLSIIKSNPDKPDETEKLFYNENVYRVSKGTGCFKEIMQTGVECMGKVGTKEVSEILDLAAESLKILPGESILTISDVDMITEIIDKLALTGENQNKLFKAIGEKNIHEAGAIMSLSKSKDFAELLTSLIGLDGSLEEETAEIEKLMSKTKLNSYEGFKTIVSEILNSPQKNMFRIDFSTLCDINYYNGIVFKGFLKGIPSEVLSGGQYDRLMNKLGHKSSAIGFAVYTDALERIDIDEEKPESSNENFINIALPKGRLGERVYELFAKIGCECPDILEENRKLIFENTEKKVRYFWVKPSDVAIYVERGAADIGIAGKDIILEAKPDIYELLDLNIGKCKMAVAAKKGFKDDQTSTLKVATKFTNIAKSYYEAKGRDIDIIKLNGSIELAPILGLSDVIVDIVETGRTLEENDLEVIEDVVPISARLIANKTSFRFMSKQIEAVADRLSEITETK